MFKFPYHIILASGSPRRKELLEKTGLTFEVRVSHATEQIPAGAPVMDVPEMIAIQKLEPVLEAAAENELIIAADTVVIFENKIYGKPKNKMDAIEMLTAFSGKKHTVVSGVAFSLKKKPVRRFSVVTDVYFYPLEKALIEYYIDTFKPFDKAGSYAIQEVIGLAGVEKIHGCFYNVIGLPVSRLMQELKNY